MNSHQPKDSKSFYQHTLKDSFTCIGVGLHTGLKIIMTVMPAAANTGYRFIRRDLSSRDNEVLASWHTVTDTHLSTTVANTTGVRVSTIEHLMAALHGSGVDNARIVLDGPEVPIMDGSAKPFIELIESVGRKQLAEERKVILIKQPVNVSHGDKCASLVPSPEPWIDMFIDFESAVIGQQRLTIPINRDTFKNELSGARTFGFSEQIEILKKFGFARGGSLQNAILVDKKGVVNAGGLRYTDEFVRHKVLDAVGDLALAGAYIIGCYRARFAGHRLNNELLRTLMRDQDAFEYISLRDANQRYFSTIEFEKPRSQGLIQG